MDEQFKYDPPGAIRHKKKRVFLRAYSTLGSIWMACIKAEIHRSTYYDWRDSDVEFMAAVAEAEDFHVEMLEAKVNQRAFEGLPRMKFNKNGLPLMDPKTRQPYIEYVFSDSLAALRLKKLRPNEYREQQHHTVVVTDERRKAEADRITAMILKTANGNGHPHAAG